MTCKKCGKEIPEGLEYCADCAVENAMGNMQVLSSAKKSNKKALTAVIIAAIAAVIAVVVIIFVITGKDKNGGNTQYKEIESIYVDEEGSTKKVTVTVPVEEKHEKEVLVGEPGDLFNNGNNNQGNNKNEKPDNNQNGNNANQNNGYVEPPKENENDIGSEVKEDKVVIADDVKNSLDSFFKGKFYFTGNMYYSDGSVSRMTIAANGRDFEGIMYESDITMGIMFIDGKTYIKNPVKGLYLEFTDELSELLDISPDDFMLDDISKMFGTESSTPDAQYRTTVNGKEAVCYSYKKSDNADTRFYFVGNDLVEIDQYEADGSLISQIDIDEFSYSIPSGMLTLNGLKKGASLISMMS